MSDIEFKSYKDKEGVEQRYLDFVTPVAIIDSAALITPRAYEENGVELGKPKFIVRALFDTKEFAPFHKKIADESRRLINNKTQLHPFFAPKDVEHNRIVRDFIKIGSEYLKFKKLSDEATEGDNKAKKQYHPDQDYLEKYSFFYAKTIKPVVLKDRFGKDLAVDSDEFFQPSFYGKLHIRVIRIDDKDALIKGFGGKFICYLQGVQYIKHAEFNWIKKSDGQGVNKFGVVEEDEVSTFPTAKTTKKGGNNGVTHSQFQDDIDDHSADY